MPQIIELRKYTLKGRKLRLFKVLKPYFVPILSIDPANWSDVSYHVEKGPIPLDTFEWEISLFREVLNTCLEAEMPIAWTD